MLSEQSPPAQVLSVCSMSNQRTSYGMSCWSNFLRSKAPPWARSRKQPLHDGWQPTPQRHFLHPSLALQSLEATPLVTYEPLQKSHKVRTSCLRLALRSTLSQKSWSRNTRSTKPIIALHASQCHSCAWILRRKTFSESPQQFGRSLSCSLQWSLPHPHNSSETSNQITNQRAISSWTTNRRTRNLRSTCMSKGHHWCFPRVEIGGIRGNLGNAFLVISFWHWV